MRIYFLRHGETDWNVKQLCQGQKDIPLNAKGKRQAHKAAETVKNLEIQTIFSSPLLRAKETAEIISNLIPLAKLQTSPLLMERAWGEYQGVSSEKMYAYEEAENNNNTLVPLSDKEFETKEIFKTRIQAAFNAAMKLKSPILIVSHGRFFRCLCEVLEIPATRQIENAVPIRLALNEEIWSLEKMQKL